jgi:hypothetical protein
MSSGSSIRFNLADFLSKLSDMILNLQGKNKCIDGMLSTVSFNKSKFEQMMIDLTSNTFDPIIQDHLEKYPNFAFQTEKYVTKICSVIQDIRK